MKIKKSKTMTIKKGGDAAGGAAIADRFRLDAGGAGSSAHAGVKTVSRKAALCALIAGFIALALVGSLTLVMMFHWLFLMPA